MLQLLISAALCLSIIFAETHCHATPKPREVAGDKFRLAASFPVSQPYLYPSDSEYSSNDRTAWKDEPGRLRNVAPPFADEAASPSLGTIIVEDGAQPSADGQSPAVAIMTSPAGQSSQQPSGFTSIGGGLPSALMKRLLPTATGQAGLLPAPSMRIFGQGLTDWRRRPMMEALASGMERTQRGPGRNWPARRGKRAEGSTENNSDDDSLLEELQDECVNEVMAKAVFPSTENKIKTLFMSQFIRDINDIQVNCLQTVLGLSRFAALHDLAANGLMSTMGVKRHDHGLSEHPGPGQLYKRRFKRNGDKLSITNMIDILRTTFRNEISRRQRADALEGILRMMREANQNFVTTSTGFSDYLS